MLQKISISLGLAILSVFVAAAPIENIEPCVIQRSYTATATSDNYVGPPTIFGRPVVQGGTMQLEASYSVGVTIEVGLDLGIDYKALAGGIGIGVGITTEHATAEAVSYTCPNGGGWSCALILQPIYLRVQGMVDIIANGDCSLYTGLSGPQPYTVNFPKVDGQHIAELQSYPCTCENKVGWADPGHIAQLCPIDCPGD